MNARTWLTALAISTGICSFSFADVTGKATFEGDAPKPKQINMNGTPQCAALHVNPVFDPSVVVGPGGELKNVAVHVKGTIAGAEVPKDPVVLDQKGCMYEPHVVTVMVGQQLMAKNSDGFLHNVHTLSKNNGQVNFPQVRQGQVDAINATAQAETFRVKCDVHPWMSAIVVVVDNPYSAVTGDDGTFMIKGLKDGKYTLVAEHEKYGKQEAEIEVQGGKATKDFKFTKKK